MNRDDVIRLAREAGMGGMLTDVVCTHAELERFAALVAAAERAKVVEWMAEQGYATGHGDTTEDMLEELEWQIAEREREACARMCEVEYAACWHNSAMAAAKAAERCATAIRLRGGK